LVIAPAPEKPYRHAATICLVTDEEYRRALDLMFIEVNDAVQVFYTYLAMSELATEDRKLFQTLNRDPLFWSIQAYCLQTTFFIIFFRIFDPASDAHSIYAFLKATRENPKLFSRTALAKRKRDSGLPYDVCEEFVRSAWEPTQDDLNHIATPLKGCKSRFEDVYQPIRSRVFAHGILKDPERAQLISMAQIQEIIGMLTALQKVVKGLTQLYQDGTRPDYDAMRFDDREQAKNMTRKALDALIKGYENSPRS
jgi:hypothetical protein